MNKPRVCIVTPDYLSSTPRVVREADALHAAGFEVRVVFSQGQMDRLREFDADLLAVRPWRHAIVKWSSARAGERSAYYQTGLRQRIARRLTPRVADSAWLVNRAVGRTYPELAALAAAEPADLFVGHYPAGLAAAAHAASRHQAALGYDVEDLYADVWPVTPAWAPERQRIIALERRYVPGCQHVSAVSAPVAEEFASRYKTPQPTLVHNCHPWSARGYIDGKTLERQGPALSLFWFSQVVGLDRGIQDAIRAAAIVRGPVQIHLRGSVSEDVRRELSNLAEACGIRKALHFHPRCSGDELLSRAAEHDVGLALETDDALSRRLSVTNKLFLYLTAGLAIAATDLPGQRSVMDASPDSGFLYRQGDVGALAAALQDWLDHPDRLISAKKAALDAARLRWNAEREGAGLSEAIARVLDARRPVSLANCG